MSDAPAGPSSVTGSLPLYKNPKPINVQAHKGKGLSFTDKPFGFLAEQHFVPLTMGEFAPASARFPVIFLGERKTPVAAMGIQAGVNLFVDPETGQFEQFAYLPAFVRRYPFVAASHTEDKERFTVCVDEGSHLYSNTPEEPFFGADDQPTPFLERAIDFVRRFENDVKTTESFVARMEELDLFDQQSATFQPRDGQGQPNGEPQVVASYWGISGEKLQKLPAETLVELRDNTYLGAIYAHMISMAAWEYVITRAALRQGVNATMGDLAPPPAPES